MIWVVSPEDEKVVQQTAELLGPGPGCRNVVLVALRAGIVYGRKTIRPSQAARLEALTKARDICHGLVTAYNEPGEEKISDGALFCKNAIQGLMDRDAGCTCGTDDEQPCPLDHKLSFNET